MNATLEKKPKHIYQDFSLSVKDMEFLSSKMGVSLQKATSLFEEKKDLDLVIYQIFQNNKIYLKELTNLSFYLYVKMLVFHYSKKHSFSFAEKNYIADVVFHSYPKVKNEEVQVSIKVKKDAEKMAGYSLIIVSFFDDVLNKFEDSKNEVAKLFLDFIVSVYGDLKKDFISDNLEEWILILKKMKKKLYKKV